MGSASTTVAIDRDRLGHDVDKLAPWIASSGRCVRQYGGDLNVCGAAALVRRALEYRPPSVNGRETRSWRREALHLAPPRIVFDFVSV